MKHDRVHPLVITLIKARHDARLSQVEVAARLRVAPSAVGNWEAGIRIPKVDNLTAWADLFGYRLTLTPKDAPKC